MTQLYRVHVVITVTDANIEGYEWEDVARRVTNRIKRSARKPLDRDARLRIQTVTLDTAKEPDA